jgi:uncharacterized RDD family membrane protein YckC
MSANDHVWKITDPICIIFLVFIILYFIILEKIFGQTLGKYLMRIKVISVTDEKLSLKQVIIRFALLVLDSFLLGVVGLISILKSESKQRIGDRLSDTVVISCDGNKKDN